MHLIWKFHANHLKVPTYQHCILFVFDNHQGLVTIQFTTSVRKYELWRQTFHLQPPCRHRPAPSPPLLCSKYNCDLWMPSLLVNCFNTAATSLLTTMTKTIYLGLVFLVYIVSECIVWELLDIISNFWATGFAGNPLGHSPCMLKSFVQVEWPRESQQTL